MTTRRSEEDRTMNGLTWKQIGAMLGGLAALSTLHASYVVPTIMSRASKEMDQKIIHHLANVHPDAVSHKELALTIGVVKVQLEAIEHAVNRLTERIDGGQGR